MLFGKPVDELTPDEHRAFMDEQRRDHPMHHDKMSISGGGTCHNVTIDNFPDPTVLNTALALILAAEIPVPGEGIMVWLQGKFMLHWHTQATND